MLGTSQGRTTSFAKARTDGQLSELADLDRVVDGPLSAALAKAVRQGLEALAASFDEGDAAEVLRGASGKPGVPAAMAKDAERAFLSLWNGPVWRPVASAAVAGEARAGVPPGTPSGASVYVVERGAQWARLMARQQAGAWREAARLASDPSLGIPAEDRAELAALATGLTARDAAYLVRQQAAIVGATEKSLPAVRKRLRASVKRRAFELLRGRAVRTAEYELAKAYNDGKRLAHAQALKVGLAKRVVATWVTAKDEDVCERCGPLHGKARSATSASTLYNRWSEGVLSVPAHIKCRCTVIYEAS